MEVAAHPSEFSLNAQLVAALPRSKKTMRRNQGGFTLVELLVVVMIVITLTALTLPALSKAKVSAFKVADSSNLRQLYVGWSLYQETNDGVLLGNFRHLQQASESERSLLVSNIDRSQLGWANHWRQHAITLSALKPSDYRDSTFVLDDYYQPLANGKQGMRACIEEEQGGLAVLWNDCRVKIAGNEIGYCVGEFQRLNLMGSVLRRRWSYSGGNGSSIPFWEYLSDTCKVDESR